MRALSRFSDLHRRKPSRNPKRRFFLICEGRNTEPDYFSALANTLDSAIVDVRISPGVGSPMTIAKAAVEIAQELKLIGSAQSELSDDEKLDQVWAVFDRDEHPDFNRAVRLCEESGIGVARSNPCFEVWLILHFEDFHRPDHRRDVQRHLQGHIKGYDARGSKTANFTAIIDLVKKAEKRAEAQLKARRSEGSPYGCPSTTVFELTRALAKTSRFS